MVLRFKKINKNYIPPPSTVLTTTSPLPPTLSTILWWFLGVNFVIFQRVFYYFYEVMDDIFTFKNFEKWYFVFKKTNNNYIPPPPRQCLLRRAPFLLLSFVVPRC